MRVLHVHAAYREQGGEDIAVMTERQVLRGAGIEVVPFDARNPDDPVAASAALVTAAWNRRAARAVLAVARREEIDVAHVHNTWFALTAAVPAALSAAGYPVVATLHNYRLFCANGLLLRDGRHCEDCLVDRSWPGVLHRCYRGSRPQSAFAAGAIALHRWRRTWERSVDMFLTLTPAAHDTFVRAGLPSRLRLRPNVVVDPGPRPHPPSHSDTVLFVGRLSPEKGLGTLLEAWRRTRPACIRLVVIGDGPDRHLERTAPDGVSFVGRLDPAAVRERMLQARAIAVPSLYAETFGLVAVEAMAAGLPVLVSDVGDLPRLTGATTPPNHALPPGDVAAWGGALADLSTATWLDVVGAANRQRYDERFAPAVAAEDLRAIYAEVIAERAHRGGDRP